MSARLKTAPLPPEGLFIHSHTELGDLFVMEGLLRHLAESYKEVRFLTRYAWEARRLFADDKRIVPVSVMVKQYPERHALEAPPGFDSMFLGFYHEACQGNAFFWGTEGFRPDFWDREFYRVAGVDFSVCWRKSSLPPLRVAGSVGIRDGAVLVHDDGFPLPVEGRRIIPRGSIFNWMRPLSRAKEVHCIDSSVLNLVESMWANGYFDCGTELFFYPGARASVPPTMLAPWNVRTI